MLETRMTNVEEEVKNHRQILIGNGKPGGLIFEVEKLKIAEEKNQEIRSWIHSVRDQVKGAKILGGIILTILTVVGGAAYATIWKALGEILKALP